MYLRCQLPLNTWPQFCTCRAHYTHSKSTQILHICLPLYTFEANVIMKYMTHMSVCLLLRNVPCNLKFSGTDFALSIRFLDCCPTNSIGCISALVFPLYTFWSTEEVKCSLWSSNKRHGEALARIESFISPSSLSFLEVAQDEGGLWKIR